MVKPKLIQINLPRCPQKVWLVIKHVTHESASSQFISDKANRKKGNVMGMLTAYIGFVYIPAPSVFV